jgi:citronellol/citronellal dehydrogenase
VTEPRLSKLSRSIAGKSAIVTGAASGMGRATAHLFADEGARVAVVDLGADRVQAVVDEIASAGGEAAGFVTDVSDPAQLHRLVDDVVARFGGIDILVNNASAISLTGTLSTPMKRYDLMHQINTRGTFLCTQKAAPHLAKSSNPHVLNISPPLHSTLSPRWFGPHVAYTMAKYGMSLCALGMAEEFRPLGIAVNALWPRTAIDTEAIRLIAGQQARMKTRSPQIMADAAHWILTQPSRKVTGRFFLDDEVLRSAGVSDFSRYRAAGTTEGDLMPDFFL